MLGERSRARLVDAGLLTVVPQGRHRYYRVAGRRADRDARARRARLREGTRAHAIRTARTCYDHLAGRLGVELMQSLTAGGDGLHHLDGDG